MLGWCECDMEKGEGCWGGVSGMEEREGAGVV